MLESKSMSNDITLPEAKYGHALDEYYGFLQAIVANNGGTVGPGQRLVTLNTITPYSIVKGKPLYNSFVLRAFADLVVRRSSSASAGSPKEPSQDIIESANSGDAWSFEYFRLAFPNLLQELKKYIKDPSVQARIVALESSWDGAHDAYTQELDKLEDAWDEHATRKGLSEDADPARYFREKSAWWRKRRDKMQRLYDKQFQYLVEIADLELAHLDAQGLLFKDLKDSLSTQNHVKLPIRPELESGVASDPTNSPADYDRRPAIFAAGSQVFDDLLDESNDGDEAAQFQRGYEVRRQKTTKYSHDIDWGASGSARKFFFLRANLGIAEKRHFEEQITKIGRIQVGFRAIQEIIIVRGRWYSGSFLRSATFQQWLAAQPEFREKLGNLVTSVIVCRGLTVRLSFDSDIHQNSWRELKVKGSGGLSIGGWNFGMSGHYNSRTEWDVKDVTNNSVTFADGPKVCRVIGLKVEEVLPAPVGAKSVVAAGMDDGFDAAMLADLRAGRIDYSSFIDRVHGR
jgi:hypothetical protein